MTGTELKAHRKTAGLTQQGLAKLAGIGRDAVSYWECKASIDLRGWAVRRMLTALGVAPDAVLIDRNARARAWGLRQSADLLATFQTIARVRPATRHEGKPSICGAKTRKGEPCRNKGESGKRRCKFHGGMSTGPKTEEGRARIAEGQRARWEKLLLVKREKL